MGAALAYTRRRADQELSLALDLRLRLPRVHRALDSGGIDARKAAVINRENRHLEVGKAKDVVNRLLETAPSLTTGQLRARLQRLCIEVDPKTALERMEYSLSQRKVAREQAEGEWTATVTDPETGEPLHVVALRRRPTAKQLRKIRSLHPTCMFPGCRLPARNCDIDHMLDYALGGKTLVCNQVPLCRRHHAAKHRAGWRYRKISRTGVEWTSRLGRRYLTGRPP